MNKVVVAEGENALNQIIGELEIKKVLKNCENIFIKPNLRAASSIKYAKCAITNPLLIKSLAEELIDLGKNVSIGECTSSKYITQKALENSGVQSMKRDGIKVINLNLSKTKSILINAVFLRKIKVPLPIINSDFVISLPVMKTHMQTLVTLSMKNMMGAMSEMEPSRMHCAGIHQSIAYINAAIKPDLCIIDATRAMEGSGPVRGNEVILDTLIGGYDPVSVDSIGAKIMGLEPYLIEHIVLAEKIGVGKIEPDIVVGHIKSRNFIRPGDDEVKFTDYYSFKWFNMLMSNRVAHRLAYDYFYYLWKKARR
jgi:uncharacterized protein (DUF362 family)